MPSKRVDWKVCARKFLKYALSVMATDTIVCMNSSHEAILEGLDDAQRSAATTLQGPVRIIAGAGAGKTRTITRRIAYACATGDWDPSRVLAVTFSVKAAAEMRSRCAALGVGESVSALTFHSAALHQLRSVWTEICDAPFPHIMRESQTVMFRALQRVCTDQFTDNESRDILAEINWAKISLIAPEDYALICAQIDREPPVGLSTERFSDIFNAYEQEKTSRGEIDFDDILLLTCHVLEAFKEESAAIRSGIQWLTVDEYQDISPLQHRLMQLWLGDNRNVCVVGDPAQTIYSFAGASSYALLNFSQEFAPVAADISLNNDYRSFPPIVRCANRVLAAADNRQDYLKLAAVRSGGTRVAKTVYDNDTQEAYSVATQIRRLVDKGAKSEEFAILTRVNAQQKLVCAALRSVGLQYRVRTDSGWLHSFDEDAQTRQALLDEIHTRTGSGFVTISTIHASKGMEFNHVFLIGCSEGLLPYGSPQPGDLLEEERRLMYVGVTRAQDSLHLSYARHKDESNSMMRSPSRFLG